MDTSRAVEVYGDEATTLLAAVADPARLRIVHVLASGPRCVCDLQEAVPLAANLLSYHLRVLREAGLIEGSRRGRWIDYRLAPCALDRLHGTLPAPAPRERRTSR